MNGSSSMARDQIDGLKSVVKQCKQKLIQIGSDHRALHQNVSRVGKTIERHFSADYHTIAPIDLYESEKYLEILNQIISEHFYRQGI